MERNSLIESAAATAAAVSGFAALARVTADFNSGTGKSRFLIALGLAACDQGRRVRYVITAQLANGLHTTKRGG